MLALATTHAGAWDDVRIEADDPATMHVAGLHEAGDDGYWATGGQRAALLSPDGAVRRLDIADLGVVAASRDGTLLGWAGAGRPCLLVRHGLEGPRWSTSLAAICEAVRPATDGGAWALARATGELLPQRLLRWSSSGALTLDLSASTLGGRGFARSMAAAPDGAVVVVVYADGPEPAQLLKLSAAGVPAWRRGVSVGAGGMVATRRLLEHPGGGYLLDAYEELPGETDVSELQDFDEAGRLQWRYPLGSTQQERPLQGVFAIPGDGWGVVAHQGTPGAPATRWVGRLRRDGTPAAWQPLADDESCPWIDDQPACRFAVDGQGVLLAAITSRSQQRIVRLGATTGLPDAVPPAGGWATIIDLAATGDGGVAVLDAPLGGTPRMFALAAGSPAMPRPAPIIEDAGSRGVLDLAWSPTGEAWLLSAGGVSARARLIAYPPSGGPQWVAVLPGADSTTASTVGAVAASTQRICAVRHRATSHEAPRLYASCHARDDGRVLWAREFDGFFRSSVRLRAVVDPADGALVFGAQLRFDTGGSRVHLFRLDAGSGATTAEALTPVAARSALGAAPDGIVVASSSVGQPTRFLAYRPSLQVARETNAGDDRPVDVLLPMDGERVLALGAPWDAFDGQVLSGIVLTDGTGWRTTVPQFGRDARLAARGDRAWAFGVSGPWEDLSLLTVQFDPRTGLEGWRRSEPIGARLAGADAIGVAGSPDGRHVYAMHSGLSLPLRLRVLDSADGTLVYGYEAPPAGVRNPRVNVAVASDGALRALVAAALPGARERPALVRLDVPGQAPLLRDGFEPAAP